MPRVLYGGRSRAVGNAPLWVYMDRRLQVTSSSPGNANVRYTNIVLGLENIHEVSNMHPSMMPRVSATNPKWATPCARILMIGPLLPLLKKSGRYPSAEAGGVAERFLNNVRFVVNGRVVHAE